MIVTLISKHVKLVGPATHWGQTKETSCHLKIIQTAGKRTYANYFINIYISVSLCSCCGAAASEMVGCGEGYDPRVQV